MQRIGPEALTTAQIWRAKFEKTGWWHSFELPDGRLIQGANTLESLKRRLALLPIPQDLSGKRVLDIGAWDGWFSFEMERRGAQVVAVDSYDSKNFRYLQRELRSKIDYRILDMYQLSPATLGGTFDIVLFLGVLYHLKHPLLALEKICALTRDLTVIQTFVSQEPGSPVMEFFEIDELGGQLDNWCAPNIACVTAMARTAGFARAEVIDTNVRKFKGATFACYRHFPGVAQPTQSAPVLAGCKHAVHFGINFRSDLDEYASAWFTCDSKNLARADVQLSIGAFHTAPVAVALRDGTWQVNFKIPPGLAPGWNDVRVRTTSSPWSNPSKFALDMPVEVASVAITSAADGKSWTPFEVRLSSEAKNAAVLSLWIEGLPENRDHRNLHIRLGDHVLEADSFAPWELGKPAQVNVFLPEDVTPGTYPLTVAIGGVTAAPVSIRLV
jgi:tRNA (mo5U34)-methyltransferase